MAASNASQQQLDRWRAAFRGTGADIFEVIEAAIAVAAADRPDEFGRQRDRIAEKLFSYRFSHRSDEAEVPVHGGDEAAAAAAGGEPEDHPHRAATAALSNYNYYEAEELTDEIEEESQLVGEVFRIKEVLMNEQDESEGALFESLRRLQLMQLSVETLGATEIGRAVSGLKRHKSKKIRQLARALVEAWKVLVNQWMIATAAIDDGTTPDSVVLSAADEDEGLPFPPLDEGALLAATQPAPMELSKFFEGIDEDGNPQNTREPEKKSVKKVSGRPPVVDQRPTFSVAPIHESPPSPSYRSANAANPKDLTARPGDVFRQRRSEENDVAKQRKPQCDLARQGKPSGPLSKPRKPPMENNNKPSSIPRPQIHQQKRASASSAHEKPRNDEEDNLVRAKLEIAKRKLHEGYRQAEDAKKQRTIQVMELNDLPRKAPFVQRRPHQQQKVQQKSKLKSLLNGRR